MHEPLDNVHIQALENDFILPIVIRQMMQGLEPLDQIAALTMHDILEELEPDTALLCIALSARKIALHCAHMPAAGMLEKGNQPANRLLRPVMAYPYPAKRYAGRSGSFFIAIAHSG